MGADRTLGGVIRLDPALARAAVAALGQALGGMTAEATADGIVRIAVARMTSSIREISIERGHDPRDFTLIAFGGAGPMHAIPIAEELGIPRVVVPPHPGNFSALGLLASDVKHDDVRTRIGRLDESASAIAALAGEMENAAAARLDAEGFAPPARRMEHSLDLRYAGQAFELNVPRPAGPPAPAALAADFHARHLATYGHSDPEGVVELVNVRLAAYGLYPEGASAAHIGRGETPPPLPSPDQSGTRVVWFDDRPGACSIHARAGLSAGVRLAGPAIVEESGATSVVFPGWVATVDAWGNLRLERG
jgi:N-methylhydantoinase A